MVRACRAVTEYNSVLSRTTLLHHRESGVSLQTPLLVPSFSSRGFARYSTGRTTELQKVLRTSAEFLTDVFLVSAFDIAHNHLPSPTDFPCKPALVFVDSGGYEISGVSDYSTAIHEPAQDATWTSDFLHSIYHNWPPEMPAVFVSFDHPKERHNFESQVASARMLFRNYQHHLNLFLLKPETAEQTTLDNAIRSAVAHPDELAGFDIVGVTEKELGNTMLDRMCEIAKLRFAMDDANISSPIHVFGALDPIAVCFYFVAGAEIFDGLTWLRYAFHDDVCVYKHNAAVLDYGLTLSDDAIQSLVLSKNLYALESLRERMSVFHSTQDFRDFGTHSALIEAAGKSLRARFPGRS